eukprot:PhM_4_TR4276/c0_g1_i1/m.31814
MTQVNLIVYELIDEEGYKTKEFARDIISSIGVGLYHSGVEVYDKEWSFGADLTNSCDKEMDGIFDVEPRTCLTTFKCSVPLGTTAMTSEQVDALIESLKPQWKAITYHLLTRNCNCFTFELVSRLAPENALVAQYPPWINRAASVGSKVVPEKLTASILKLICPPGPVPPGMENRILVHYGAVPKVPPTKILSPTQMRERDAESVPAEANAEKKSGGLRGLLSKGADVVKKGVTAVDSRVRNSIDSNQEQKFRIAFPDSKETWIATYKCKVEYGNLPVKAKIVITDRVLFVYGERNLRALIPYGELASIRFATAKPNELKHLPPTIELVELDSNYTPQTHSEPDALMIFTKKGEVFSAWKFNSFGATLDNFVATTVGTSSVKITPVVRAYSFLDSAWREVCTVPVAGVAYGTK